MAILSRSNSRNTIEPLTPAHLRDLHMTWRSKLSMVEIHDCLVKLPSRSVWNPVTHEYAIVSNWRNRDDVVQIADIGAVRYPEELVIAASNQARALGAELTVIIEIDESRRPTFYERCGFQHLENVITFELDLRRVPSISLPESMTFVRADVRDPVTLSTLITIDHAAFPWIWWNTEVEFHRYAEAQGVELYLGFVEGHPVSYIGSTSYPEWGHLDRIAVLPEKQGSGYGRYALDHAVKMMLARGSRRIGLSTQSDNSRSRRLYEQFGFVRTASNDYDLWGDTLNGGNARRSEEKR